jgi:putative ABC transport system substrate-binding protein
MDRREFIGLLAGTLLTATRAAGAQQAMPVVGVLHNASRAEFADYVSGFHHGLRQLGYVDGQNVVIEFRWAEGQYERLTHWQRTSFVIDPP